jgi:hypothetical protein
MKGVYLPDLISHIAFNKAFAFLHPFQDAWEKPFAIFCLQPFVSLFPAGLQSRRYAGKQFTAFVSVIVLIKYVIGTVCRTKVAYFSSQGLQTEQPL